VGIKVDFCANIFDFCQYSVYTAQLTTGTKHLNQSRECGRWVAVMHSVSTVWVLKGAKKQNQTNHVYAQRGYAQPKTSPNDYSFNIQTFFYRGCHPQGRIQICALIY
jgi:hypothetical protein